MKRACSLIAGVLLCIPASGATQTTDPLDDLFTRGRAAQADIRTLSASFTETTVSTLLRDPLVATGTLQVIVPLRVVMTYTTPTEKTVALDETRLVVWWPSTRKREELNIAATQRRVRRYFTDAPPTELREMFTIALSTDSAFHNSYRLELTPKRKQIAEGLERLRIWVDPVRLLMLKMAMDYPGGDSKTLELRDVRTNLTFDDGAFALLERKP